MLAIHGNLKFDSISFAVHCDEQVQIYLRLERRAMEPWHSQAFFKLDLKTGLSKSNGQFQLQ